MPKRVRHLPWIVCLFVVFAFLASCSSSSSPNNATHSTVTGDHGDGDNGDGDTDSDGGSDPDADLPGSDRGPQLPEDAFLAQRLGTTGVPSLRSFDIAGAQAAAIRASTARFSPLLAKKSWTFLGPKTVGGRVVDVAVDPNQKGGLYVATSTAGIWHSTDSGSSFTQTWPDTLPHAMGAIAIASNGTIFVGTGETNPGGGSITYGGDGIYRSTDGGASWTHIGLTSSGTIGRIAIDPTDPNHIWVAVSGNLFVPGGQRGVYESTDGGNTWTRSFKPPNNTTGAVDVAVDPADPNHVVAALWDHLRKPDDRRYTGKGSGIWETHNGGTTWTRLGTAQGLPASSADTGRIGIAFAPSDSDRMYAIYANDASGAFQNFFTSDDNGASWTRPAGAGSLGGSQSTYGWWFGRVFVDPKDANHLYLTGLNMYQSTNAAGTFTTVGGLHADQHVVAWDTHNGGDIYVGDDGGLYASATGSGWTHSNDEPWSQYDSLDVSEQDPTRFIGGLQDNGTRASWTNPAFQDVTGGDGQRAMIDPTDENVYYGCYQYGECTGFDNGSQFSMPIQSDRFPFFMPMELQPGAPQTIFAGGNELNRSTDGGHSFSVITGDLGHGGSSGSYPYGTISAIGLSASDPQTVWIGTDNGYLYKSTTGGSNPTQLPPPVKGRPWITRITVDATNPQSVYVTFSGYRSGNNAPYVMHTADGGSTWTDVSANLPKAPVSDLVIVGKNLYVATDVGVFTSSAANPSWKSMGHGLPGTIISELRYIPKNKTLYASTFGEGVWSVSLK